MGIGGGGYGYGGSYQGGYGQPMMRGGFGGMRGGMGRGFGSVVNPMMMRGGFNPGMVRGRGGPNPMTAVRGRKANPAKPKFVIDSKAEEAKKMEEAKKKIAKKDGLEVEEDEKESDDLKQEENVEVKVEKKAPDTAVTEESKRTDAMIAELKKKAEEIRAEAKREEELKKSAPMLGQGLPKEFGKKKTARENAASLASAVIAKVEKKEEEEDTFNYPATTVHEFESKVLKAFHPTMWVNETARRRNWFVQNREGASGPPNNRRFKHSITVKEVTVEATAKKKKDAKNLAFKLMAVKLGEILRLLKPQPGTVRTQLNEQIRVMLCDGPRGLFGTSRMPPLKPGSDEGRQNRDEIRKGKQIPNLGKRGRSRSRSSRRSPSPRQARSPGRGNRRRSESGSPRRKQSPEQFLNLRTGTSYRSSRRSPRQNSSPRQIPSLGKESRCRDRSRSPRRRW